MKYRSITRRAAGLGLLLAAVAGGSAQAATPATMSACSAPSYTFSQPFSSLKDTHWYTLAPGQSVNSFSGTGWTLTGGARIVTTILADGSFGKVLDLPAGATAVSPPLCVNSSYPDARMNLREFGYGAAVHAYVAYTSAKSGGQSSGALLSGPSWGASRAFQLHAGDLVGWQLAQYTFVADRGEAQVYNFYVDPHCFR